ncbi:hypothetical protein ALC62_00136, partial [Cyphomyrmex costatus]
RAIYTGDKREVTVNIFSAATVSETDNESNLFNVDVFYRESSLDEFRVEPMKSTRNSPDSFCNRSCGFLTNEHMASKPLQSGVLRNEAEVAMITRVKCTKRYILQRVEIIVTRTLIFLKICCQLET